MPESPTDSSISNASTPIAVPLPKNKRMAQDTFSPPHLNPSPYMPKSPDVEKMKSKLNGFEPPAYNDIDQPGYNGAVGPSGLNEDLYASLDPSNEEDAAMFIPRGHRNVQHSPIPAQNDYNMPILAQSEYNMPILAQNDINMPSLVQNDFAQPLRESNSIPPFQNLNLGLDYPSSQSPTPNFPLDNDDDKLQRDSSSMGAGYINLTQRVSR
jgi:hypothetical protein